MINIGYATSNIVPPRPAMVQGQMHVRIADKAIDPLIATAMALQGHRPDGTPDCAIIISLDVALVTAELQEAVCAKLAGLLPSVPSDKIFLTATHTHTSMVFIDGAYPMPEGDVMTPSECTAFLIDRASDAAVAAWKSLAPCKIARAYGHAVVAHNRRPVYADGTAQMYGNPANKEFRWIEGPEDHSIDMIFVWDKAGQFIGALLDIPCPAQVVENLTSWSADFWHDIREDFKTRFGRPVWVMPMLGAAGDQSPHFIFDNKQEAQMRSRRGVTECQEIAQRVGEAAARALACTKPIEGDVVLAHDVHRFTLPARTISKSERDWHQAQYNWAIKSMSPELWWPKRLKNIVEQYDGTFVAKPYPVEMHALRIADAVIVTNPFELFTDYAFQIKARSAAAQTFTSQLTAGAGLYLPTLRGALAGGYGSVAVVSHVGPDGGQELVERTVQAIDQLFAPAPVSAASA